MCNLCGEDEQNVMKMRHTLSHVLAAALVEMYPGVQFGVGPATATGFYYDIDLSEVKDVGLGERKSSEIQGGIDRRFARIRDYFFLSTR